MFLYYYRSPQGWFGWMSGPEVGRGRGGLLLQSRSLCVEDGARDATWQYFNGDEFVADDRLSVTCFVPGGNEYSTVLGILHRLQTTRITTDTG